MKDITVTIGIAAYNEEGSIGKTITSVMEQVQKGFKIEKIMVSTDCPTDNTVEVIKKLQKNNSLIQLIESQTRGGKMSRINDIYQNIESDVLVQLDADIKFENKDAIKNMLEVLYSEKEIMLVGGNVQPIKPNTFVGKGIYYTYKAYDEAILKINNGHNIHSIHGCFMGMKKEFIKRVKVPTEILGDDVYLYYLCLNQGYKYKFSKNSIVRTELPTNLKDHIRQNTRYFDTGNTVDKYFPEELVAKETYMDTKALLRAQLLQFIKSPFSCAFIFGINQYCKYKANKNKGGTKVTWDLTMSSRVK